MKKLAASVQQIDASEFLRNSMRQYGLEVIENRALPRIEDGLKPVQRFCIWAAHDMRTSTFVKCAKVSGKIIGEFHPHSDEAVYETIVNMVNDRYGAIEGHGNFGSMTTSYASSRYTECRLSPLIKKICTDLPDMEVIPYEKNYDDTKNQPVFLPMAVPYLLLLGSEGIAVALTSKIPSFNLNEVCEAVVHYLKHGNLEKSLLKIQGPDVGNCALISSKSEVRTLLDTGEGTLEYESIHSVESARGSHKIIVTGYAPEFNLESFLRQCGKLQDEGLVDFVRNETSKKNGDRVVIAVSDLEVYRKKILPLLRKKISYKFNVLFSESKSLRPRMCKLGDIIREWVEIRRKIVRDTLSKKICDLKAVRDRETAKKKALLNLKQIFEALQSPNDFKAELVSKLGFSTEEAQMIADMRVESLKNSSLAAVDKKILEMDNEIARISADLNQVDKVIIQQINDILSWAQKNAPDFLVRKTRLLA